MATSKNGYEALVVRIETFLPCFDMDMYMIDHHNGDEYLWDRDINNLEPQALQAGTTPVSRCSENAHPNGHKCTSASTSE